MNAELEKLVEEIRTIDKRAWEMAALVLKNPVLRKSLAPQAAALGERLLVVADALKTMEPNRYEEWGEQISESVLDLQFVEQPMDIVSLRLGRGMGEKKSGDQKNGNQHETSFPIPNGVKNFTRTLKSDLVSFQTDLSLKEIAQFYRESFAKRGCTEYGLITSTSKEHLSLAFLGLPQERMAVVQAIDLGYKTHQDQRYVSLWTEEAPPPLPMDSSSEEGKRIQLVEDLRETCTYIYVEVIGTGDLLMAGTRAGEAPRKTLDRDSLGYWVTVSCDQKEKVLHALVEKIYGPEAWKNPELLAMPAGEGNNQEVEARDRLLLRCMERLYKGNVSAIQEFVELLKANGIDHQFQMEA